MNHTLIIRFWLAALVCLQPALLPGTSAARMDQGLRAALTSSGPKSKLPVIIIFEETPASIARAAAGNGPERSAARTRSLRSAADARRRQLDRTLGRRGTSNVRSLWLINGLALTAGPDLLRQLEDMPGIAAVRLDQHYHKDEVLMAPGDAPEANIVQVGAPALWRLGHFGQGVTVGLMDTGADLRHPDLADTFRGGANSWLDPYEQHATPFDGDPAGHGTGVLGIMVGGDAGGTTIGVAPKTKWIAARMFDDQDMTSDSVIISIFQWFLDPDGNPVTDDAPDIVNGSWGVNNPGACEDTFQAVVAELDAAGILMVFAAGNYGPSAATSISPANYAGAIAVGAVDETNGLLQLSSRGLSACDERIYPDVVAPGAAVKTADRSFGGLLTYAVASGTSFAAPHVSGALALLAGAFPQAAPAQLKSALLETAVDLGAPGPDNDYGNGRISLDETGGAYAYLRDTQGLAECVRPDVSFSWTPHPGPIGQPVTFTAAVSDGTGPHSYAWDVDGDGAAEYVTEDPVNSIQHTYTSPYTGSIGLEVTHVSAPAGCSTNIVMADQWSCPAVSVSIDAQQRPAVAGEPVIFSGMATGGTAPYTYAWDMDGDGGADCTSASCARTYAAAGTEKVSLVITDASGCSAAAESEITILGRSSPPPDGGGGGGGCFIGVLADSP